MSKLHQIFGLLGACFLLSAPAKAQTTPSVPKQGAPPANLIRELDGHWTANKPASEMEGYEIHQVVGGDTLWDITKHYLNDPYLWPQVWELNPHVVNPHWIYPGDKIRLKKMVVLEPSAEPAPTPAEEPRKTTRTEPPPPVVSEPVAPEPRAAAPAPAAAASYSELYCSGFFSPTEIPANLIITGGEEAETKSFFSDRDIVYLNKGTAGGVKPGDEYLVVRRSDEFGKFEPVFRDARRRYGFYYIDLGRLRVLLAQEQSATAEIVFACEEMLPGDELIPVEDRQSPTKRLVAFDRFAAPSGKRAGRIVMSKEYRTLLGQGHIVYINLGKKDNLQVGDYCRIYRHFNESNVAPFNKPMYRKNRRSFQEVRKVIGELVVLRVDELASTALIVESTEDATVGDHVELE
ncbi:MAG: LysM domain-containing protein [Acidobacteriota bacterium]